MAPSTIAEPVILDKALISHKVENFSPKKPAPKPQIVCSVKPAFEFSKAVLLEQNPMRTGSKTLDVAIAVMLHVLVVGAPILAGLYYTDTINLRQFTATLLVAPPPPPPPPPAPAAAVVKAQAPKRVFVTGGRLVAPTVIPRQIAEIKEAPLEPDSLGGAAGGVPGGVPGGQMGGVLGGVLGGVINTAARPIAPLTARPSAPVRVGGRVRPPKAIAQVRPNYPPIAQQAHIQGQVQIDAILDEQGNVIDMKVVSGPPLLYQAALDALKKWKYEPTYLNDQPIAVEMIVTITFQLGQ
jgi:periplasmic protein TonB